MRKVKFIVFYSSLVCWLHGLLPGQPAYHSPCSAVDMLSEEVCKCDLSLFTYCHLPFEALSTHFHGTLIRTKQLVIVFFNCKTLPNEYIIFFKRYAFSKLQTILYPNSGTFLQYCNIIIWNLDFLKILFNFTILYWFCHISKWICHRYTCVPHSEPSSLLPPHTIPLGRPSAPAPSIQYCASNLALATHFIYDIIYISMPFSQIIPPSPSPIESKRLFCTSVSLLLSYIQGYCYHLSKFHFFQNTT